MVRILERRDAWEFLEAAVWAATGPDPEVEAAVADIIETVRAGGDAALEELSRRFGDPTPGSVRVSSEEIARRAGAVPAETRALLERAAENVRVYAEAVRDATRPFELVRTGVTVGLEFVPVERAACTVPGGLHALPSTVLMTAIPARVAGVHELAVVCPRPTDEVLLAAALAGADRVYRLGGAQGVAALAYGTESVPAVDVIAGPGNAWVTEAKRQVHGVVGIDMLAGPSEVAVIADGGADPARVALDLLAQWEHDPLARAWLLTNDGVLARAVAEQLRGILARFAFPDFVADSLAGGALLVFATLDDCAAASDRLAPEHLHLAVEDPEALRPRVRHAGGLFLGYDATVPLGDFVAGPSHTLPTGRSARFSGGLSPLTFLRPRGWLRAGPGIESPARDAAAFADLEGLPAHAAAARARAGGSGP